jgi:hypothetical protein
MFELEVLPPLQWAQRQFGQAELGNTTDAAGG